MKLFSTKSFQQRQIDIMAQLITARDNLLALNDEVHEDIDACKEEIVRLEKKKSDSTLVIAKNTSLINKLNDFLK